MSDETASVPNPIEAEPPVVPTVPAFEPAPPAVEPPAPVAAPESPKGLFDSINWSNPVPDVIKIAVQLQSLTTMTPKERIILLQGSLLYVISTSPMPDSEKETARLFVTTMVPHVVETAVTSIDISAKLAAAEEILSKQPAIIVKSLEEVFDEAAKRKWWCF
jgi:hypothetical protein